MPDIFGYIKKEKRNKIFKQKQKGITWFRLCGFSGLIYNTISFCRQKVQIHIEPSPICSFQQIDLTD